MRHVAGVVHQCVNDLARINNAVPCSRSLTTDRGTDVSAALDVQTKPTHVLNAAGLTGRPNVDWCEDHKVLRAALLFTVFALLFMLGTVCHAAQASCSS